MPIARTPPVSQVFHGLSCSRPVYVPAEKVAPDNAEHLDIDDVRRSVIVIHLEARPDAIASMGTDKEIVKA